MNAPIARFLAEFSDGKAEEKFESLGLDLMEPPEPEPEAAPSEPVVSLTIASIAQAMRDAREASANEERVRVEALMEERLAAQHAEMSEALETARAAWVSEAAEKINTGLAEGIAGLQSVVLESVDGALRPLFAEAIRSRILEEMQGALAALLGDPAHPPIRIEGPADLLTAFGEMQTGELSVEYVEADQAELTITTDTTRIESRFNACLTAFKNDKG